jgi:ArsR family transcriptional regulator
MTGPVDVWVFCLTFSPISQEGSRGGTMEEIYELHADFCKIFSNAKRLEIINALKDKEMSASELIEKIGLSKANLSQHMSVLKLKGVIVTRREGINIYYRIANPKIVQACRLIREVLFEQFKEKGKMVSSLRQIK